MEIFRLAICYLSYIVCLFIIIGIEALKYEIIRYQYTPIIWQLVYSSSYSNQYGKDHVTGLNSHSDHRP